MHPDLPKALVASLGKLSVAGHAWTQPTKSSSLGCYLYLVDISMQKIQDTTTFLLEILMVKKSWNLIGPEYFSLILVKQNFARHGVSTRK